MVKRRNRCSRGLVSECGKMSLTSSLELIIGEIAKSNSRFTRNRNPHRSITRKSWHNAGKSWGNSQKQLTKRECLGWLGPVRLPKPHPSHLSPPPSYLVNYDHPISLLSIPSFSGVIYERKSSIVLDGWSRFLEYFSRLSSYLFQEALRVCSQSNV